MDKRQEAVRNDVERFFGCLQGRFKIMRQERCEWSDTQLTLISQVYVILYNIIVKMAVSGELSEELYEDGIAQSDRELLKELFEFVGDEREVSGEKAGSQGGNGHDGISCLLERDRLVFTKERHIELIEALLHHLWDMKGGEVAENWGWYLVEPGPRKLGPRRNRVLCPRRASLRGGSRTKHY